MFVRRALDAFFASLARVALHVFFRDVHVVGRERLPPGGPLLVFANHVNNLVDPMLLLGYVGRRPRFLAKSTLWSHPVVAPLVIISGALPVYRAQDNEDVFRNFETFKSARRVLSAGGTVALFPEGRSHNEPAGLPFKTGAARIALEAIAEGPRREGGGPLPLRIVPVGLVYEDKERFRSHVVVHVGPLIDPSPEAERYAKEPRAAVRALTARMAAALAEALQTAPRRADRSQPVRSARIRWEHVASLALWPAFAVGVLLNLLPYRVPGWVAGALTRTPDEPATYKVVTALITFPIAWTIEVGLAARLGGVAWALAMSVIAPLSGYVALLLNEIRRERARAEADGRITVR